MVIAVVGSRKGAVLDDVTAFLAALYESDKRISAQSDVRDLPHTVVVSGGAQGVDKTAEQEWLRLGGRVVSLRPANIPTSSGEDEWWIERWMLMPEGNSSVIVLRDCSWSDFSGAAVYRDMLIAEYCDRLVAFQSDPPSSGTAITVGFAQAAEKPVYVYSPKARFAQAA